MRTNEELDLEEIFRLRPWYRDLWNQMPPARKPKPKLALLATVSERLGAAVNANGDSVRISARAENGVVIIERPGSVTVVELKGQGNE